MKVPHPDSLEDVFVIRRPSTGGRDSIGFKQEADLQSLLEKWSSAAGPNRYYNRESHFATLRSKELALAHVSERAGSTLSDSVPPGGTKARSDSSTAIADQLESYRETVCINVYLFGLTSKPFTDNPPDATQLQIVDQVPNEGTVPAAPHIFPTGKPHINASRWFFLASSGELISSSEALGLILSCLACGFLGPGRKMSIRGSAAAAGHNDRLRSEWVFKRSVSLTACCCDRSGL